MLVCLFKSFIVCRPLWTSLLHTKINCHAETFNINPSFLPMFNYRRNDTSHFRDFYIHFFRHKAGLPLMPMHRYRSSVRPCFHLFPALSPPLLYFATAPFLPALSPFSCPHCDVNNSCFCRTRSASARKTSLYGDRQPRCRRPSHPAYGDRHPCCRRPPHTQRYMHNRR